MLLKHKTPVSVRSLAILVLVALPGVSVAWLLQDLPPQQMPQQSLRQDFRGSKGPLPPLRLTGPDCERVSKLEEKGWRITLAADRPMPEVVGLVLTNPVQGNFEITTGYEILRADRPPKGGGVGLELFVAMDTPEQDAFKLYRFQRPREGDGFMCVRSTGIGRDRRHDGIFDRAESKTGQLRITRRGAEVAFSAAEEGETFRELYRYSPGSADLKLVRIGAYTSNDPYPVDLRITDFRIQADSLTLDPPPDAAGSSTSSPKSPRIWLLVGGLIGLILLLIAFAIWLVLGRQRRSEEAQDPSLARSENPAARSFVLFACSRCTTSIKARPELAGQKIKCPQCGQAVLVPEGQADGCDRISL